MDSVIITGASGEPALSIARRLCGMGFRVYALAGDIPETGLSADEFVPLPCDLTQPESVISALQKILSETPQISGVVLAEQILSPEPFGAVSTEEILLSLNARVAAPLCAVRLALPSLIRGRGNVVSISPSAGTPGRALDAAGAGALRAFSEALFSELRDTGVKTCHIFLQNNTGEPDPAARFTTSPQSRIQPDIVADAVETVFRLRENNALTQIVLRPQATRETPKIPVSAEPAIRALQKVVLPPAKNFPPEETPIPTQPYRRPEYAPPKNEQQRQNEADDDDGLSEDYVDPELRYLLKKNNPPRPAPAGNETAPTETPAEGGNGNVPRGNDRFARDRREKWNNRRHNRNRRGEHRPHRNFEGAIRIAPPALDPQQSQNEEERRKNLPSQEPTEKTQFSSPHKENISYPAGTAENPPPPSSAAENVVPVAQAEKPGEGNSVPAKKKPARGGRKPRAENGGVPAKKRPRKKPDSATGAATQTENELPLSRQNGGVPAE